MIWTRNDDCQLIPIPEVIGRGQLYVPATFLTEIVCAYADERMLEYEAGINYRDALIKAKAALEIYDIYSQELLIMKEEYYGLPYNRQTEKPHAKRKARK